MRAIDGMLKFCSKLFDNSPELIFLKKELIIENLSN